MYVAIPLFALSSLFSHGGRRIGFQRLPRFQLRLRTLTTIVALLAIDYGIMHAIMPRSFGLHFFISDATVLLVPLLIGTLTRTTAWDLWFIGTLVGLLGAIFSPAINAH
jgi:nitrate/nitrite transporter NarK